MESKVVAYSIDCHRRIQGMKQKDLADRLGVTANTVSRWETGKSVPTVPMLFKMAEIFDCSIDNIFLPSVSTKGE